jgi:L-ascorbate metabolism protein UlaG (beta-lactamase superfamily)
VRSISQIGKGSRLLAAAFFYFCTGDAPAQTTITIPEPSFSAPEIFTNREARLRLTVPTGTSARVDASTNLIDWHGFITTGAGSITHTDTFGPFVPLRFYRAEQLAATAVTGDHLATTNGDVIIRPVVHASFLIKWNDVVIYNDPDTGNYTGLPKGQLILIGHEHSDHWDATTINNIKATNAVIVANQDVYNQFSAALRTSTVILGNGDTTNLFGIHIEAVPAYNGNHPQGSDNGYVLTIGGRRIYMSGDTGDIPETRALQNIDVAFLSMNVPFTMTVQQAASVTRAFAPKVIYPYHYRNGDGTFANLNTFKTLVGTDLPIEVRFRKWY